MRMRRFLFLALALAGCATTTSYLGPDARESPTPALPTGAVAHEVFLLGNTGDLQTEAVLRAVALEASRAGEESTVVLLGDQTTGGLPDSASAAYAAAEAPLRALAAALRDVPGRIVAVPGDRDWARGEDGLKAQEKALEALLGRDVLTPGDQSGGPREMKLAEGFRLIVLDTAWWLLDAAARPSGEAEGEDIRSPADVTTVLDQILVDRDDDQLLVVGHHPFRSNGESAGFRTAGETIAGFGVTALAAQTVGTRRQELASPSYRRMREALDGVMAQADGLVYAAAHDHSLQLIPARRTTIRAQNFLVSGTGGGATRAVAAGRGATYAAALPGYQRLVYYADGRLWAETVTVDPATGERTVAHRTELSGPNAELLDPEVPDTVYTEGLPDEIGTDVTMAADADFVSGRFANSGARRFFWGTGYRDVWETPASFPVLDIGTEGGGLTPVKRGGGLQTTSLRLEGRDGRFYELRLLEKSGLAQVPFELRQSAVGDIVLDLRSAMNPYSAPVTWPMAEAAGVFQADQRIVFIPDDVRLGRYRETFANRLALFGIRADDDSRDVPGLLGAYDIVSAPSMLESLREDQDHRVDQRAYLRARLFDMVLGDWDRHQDQWRWAAFEPGELDPSLTGDAATKGKVYLPVARDRDFAFHNIGGLIPSLIGLYFDPRLQHFDEDIHRIRYLTANGFPQDRRFFNALTREDFVAVARDLQARLTDEAIDTGVDRLPTPIAAQIGAEYQRVLRGRRADLLDAADELYELHASTVDVIGSDEREHFTATRQADGSMVVTVVSYKRSQDGREIYRRTFTPNETNEVRLYGFGGRDRFDVNGPGSRRIGLRIIGGAGRDTLAAEGPVTVYDTPNGLRSSGRAELRLSDRGDVNTYDPHEQVLGARTLSPSIGYRPTDGVVLGATASWSVPGFRLHPYAATHTVSLNYATGTNGVFGSYIGRMREAVGSLDLDVDAFASTPRYARNFYGIGNASAFVTGDLARLDLARAELDVGVGGTFGPGLRFVAGPTVRFADPEAPTFLPGGNTTPAFNTSTDAQVHLGGFGRLTASTADAVANPRQGIRLSVGGAYRAAVAGAGTDPYGQVGGDAAVYVPLSLAPQFTLALRGGADHRFGDYPFFDAAVLGGDGAFGASAAGASATLRGFRRERFAGRTAASASAELRGKLFDLATYVAPFEVGGLAFADAGRVWSDAFTDCGIIQCVPLDLDAGQGFHTGFGGGLWLELLNQAVFTATVGRSDESTLFTFGVGFAY